MDYMNLIYLKDTINSGQHAVNKDTYCSKYALFLEDDETSEVEVLLLCSEHRTPEANQGSELTSFISSSDLASQQTIAAKPSSLCSRTSATHQSYKVPGCCRVVLKTEMDIRAVFSNNVPQLSVIYIDQDHSFECIRVTRNCFEQLLTSCDILSALRDNILHIGYRRQEVEIAPPCPRSRFLFDNSITPGTPSGHELVYGLRFIEWNHKTSGRPWSLRQCVVYNKTLYIGNLSQWLFFKPPPMVKDHVDNLFLEQQRDAQDLNLEAHIAFITAAIATWRPYLIWVGGKVENYVQQVSLTNIRGDGPVNLAADNSMVELKNLENEVLESLLAIRATKDTSVSLMELHTTAENLRSNFRGAVDCSRHKLLNYAVLAQIRQTDMLVEQATMILQKIQGTSGFIASFLNLGNQHSLRELAVQSKEETRKMSDLAESAKRDTKAVKALSIITLIYLPVTVVLNFFSTSFVDGRDGSVHVVGRWWLLVAISVPLTVMTLFVWAIWVFRHRSSTQECSSQHVASQTASPGHLESQTIFSNTKVSSGESSVNPEK